MARSAPIRRTSVYKDDVDFDALSMQDPGFAAIYNKSKGKLDFHDPSTLQQLTKTLLWVDFGLRIELPQNRLCPPVPVRWNYVRWIQRLVDTSARNETRQPESDRKVTGLDIGTGASGIYSLLACSSRTAWHMYGTDIDAASLQHAQMNVDLNDLDSRIHLRRSTVDSPLIPIDALTHGQPLDFVMCNPPFYTSAEDMAASNDAKSRAPNAVCTGAEVEMICEGGDAGFVTRIVRESLILREKVQWYSSMLGKLASLHATLALLKEANVDNVAVRTLRAGKTRRWAIAWSFGDRRPTKDVMSDDDVPQSIRLLTTQDTIQADGLTAQALAALLEDILRPVDINWHWTDNRARSEGIARAHANTWSRAARRERERTDTARSQSRHEIHSEGSPVMLVSIIVCDAHIEINWLQGRDKIIFESFCGMIRRKVREAGRDKGGT